MEKLDLQVGGLYKTRFGRSAMIEVFDPFTHTYRGSVISDRETYRCTWDKTGKCRNEQFSLIERVPPPVQNKATVQRGHLRLVTG